MTFALSHARRLTHCHGAFGGSGNIDGRTGNLADAARAGASHAVLDLPVGQCLAYVCGRLIAIVRLLGHHRATDLDQIRRSVFANLQHRRRFLRLVLDQPLGQRPVRERGVPGQQVIQRAPQSVDVGPGVDQVAVNRLLRRQVIRRAEHLFVVFDGEGLLVPLGQPRQAHIEDLDRSLFVDQQVARFDIPVDHAAAVGVGQSLSGLADVVGCFVVRQGSILLDPAIEVATLDVLHDQVVGAPLVVDVVCLHDVGMIERGDRPSFQKEAVQVGGIVNLGAGQNLDRHLTPHQGVFAQEHAAHSAGAEVLEQLVLAQEEPLVAPLHKLVVLPAGNQLFLHQQFGQRNAISRKAALGLLQLLDNLFERVVVHESAEADIFEIGIKRQLRH